MSDLSNTCKECYNSPLWHGICMACVTSALLIGLGMASPFIAAGVGIYLNKKYGKPGERWGEGCYFLERYCDQKPEQEAAQ